MDATETRLLERLLRSRIGKAATFRKYDRSLKTPMNFVLDEARSQLTRDFDVYRVDGGLPELFTLDGLSKPAVAYNSRYIELLYLIRKIVVDEHLAPFRQELAERICLRVMAEFALRHGKAGWAIRAFLHSMIGQGIHILDMPGTALLDLEQQPVSPAYMATWFFGLVHETGHLKSAIPGASQAANKVILDVLEATLKEVPHHPDALKNEALAKAKSGDVQHVLSIERLRSESEADIFAVAVLFKASLEIMRKENREFKIDQFVAEMHVFLNLIVVLERCRRMARIADDPEAPDLAAREELVLHPVSYGVRARMMRMYLGYIVARFLFQSNRPTAAQEAKSFEMVGAICSGADEAISAIDSGMAKAMRFALFPDERATNLMSQFARQLMESDTCTQEIGEADKIFDIADAFGIESESLRALQRIIEARRTPGSSGSARPS